MPRFASVLKTVISYFLVVIELFVVPVTAGDASYLKNASITLEINEDVEYQSFNGFGASAAWWAQDAGNSEYADEIAKALYSKDGLGLNIYRYNVGGGEKDNPNARVFNNRATESFYYYNEATGKYEYDFTRDAGAQKMLEKALSYGCVDTVVLFANSPHYSMTGSGSACGSYSDFTCNLPEENYEAFADYFLTITEYFLDKGVPVKYISPINEPQWSWGGGWVGQEGCHYEPDEALAVFKVFAQKIKESGLPVRLMAPESGEVGETTENYFDALYNDEEIREVLGSLAYHSYWSDNNYWGKYGFGETINEKYSDINVDMTEWCELPCSHDINDFESAMLMANVIMDDIKVTGVNSWSSWVGVNNYGIDENGNMISDGLLVADDKCTELYTAARYSAMAHFSKYIPAGSKRIYTNPSRLLGKDISLQDIETAAFKTPDGKIVLILLNNGQSLNVMTGKLTGKMEVVSSTAEKQLETVYSGRTKMFVECPADSITTVIFS